ncbi:MAG TPA: YraN family protein [Candidatus Saccharimonadales bacterium]|nr:YraN family protein [Candidatus Saccharimonadales bacterium]
MTTTETGRKAEAAASEFLERKGCKIIDRNWRTRWCEIDVVAIRDSVIYFCEVKYRLNTRQGRGAEYITAKKLRQMKFAAEFWIAARNWTGEYQLCAIEVSGAGFTITGVFRDLT